MAKGWGVMEFRDPHMPAETWQLHSNTGWILHLDCHFFIPLAYTHSSPSTCFAE